MTASVDELLPAARALARERGSVPSLRALKDAFRVGTDKAQALSKRLNAESVETPERPSHPRPRLRGRHATGLRLRPRTTGSAPRPISAAPEHGVPGVDPGGYRPEPTVWGNAPREDEAGTAPTAEGEHAGISPAHRRESTWWVWPIALAAAVSIWSGWVGLGQMAGFGIVHPLPGIWDEAQLNTAITLPIGMEAYAAGALKVWIGGRVPRRARAFAGISAGAAILIGFGGQVAYHQLAAAGAAAAPGWLVTVVSCLPVAVLAMAVALVHLIRADQEN